MPPQLVMKLRLGFGLGSELKFQSLEFQSSFPRQKMTVERSYALLRDRVINRVSVRDRVRPES